MTRYPLIELGLTSEGGWARAPAKVNLWLEVLGRRDDGFHEIETLMAPIDLCDRLELRQVGETDQMIVAGLDIPGTDENIVLKALRQARQTRTIPPLQIHLTKGIPARAGLGGGSSDAAAMLVLLDALFPAPGNQLELHQQAALLGSDVPFFLGQGAALATGRGEILKPISGPFLGGDGAFFNLIVPQMGLETPAVYTALSELLTYSDSHRNFPVGNFQESKVWLDSLYNRLLDGARRLDPRVNQIVAILEPLFAGRWTMTGSGSCFFVGATDRTSSVKDAEILRCRFSEATAGQPGPPPAEILTVPLLSPVG
ncbi:MAG: 4-(cytidine 5'-diphospho)-2-C-methyl-D-erythritol kinase [Planctomycetota bacterium]